MRKVEETKRICLACKKVYFRKPYIKTIYCSKDCQIKTFFPKGRGSERDYTSITGKNNYAWKGNKVSYFGLHAWISRELGKPSKCSNCGATKGRFEWANISREYKRELSDWARLCRSCHISFDNILTKAWITRREKYEYFK